MPGTAAQDDPAGFLLPSKGARLEWVGAGSWLWNRVALAQREESHGVKKQIAPLESQDGAAADPGKPYPERIVELWADILGEEEFRAITFTAYVNRLAALYREVTERLAKPFDLSQMDAVLLFLLRGYAQTPMSLTDIWRLYRYTPGAITHRIGRLRKQALVETRKSQTDSRVTEVELTERGREVIDAIIRASAATFTKEIRTLGMSARELEFIKNILREMEMVADAASMEESEDSLARAVPKTNSKRKTKAAPHAEKAKNAPIKRSIRPKRA